MLKVLVCITALACLSSASVFPQKRSGSLSLQTLTCIAAQKAYNIFSWNACADGAFSSNYDKMKEANCKNCDKYFHCRANYEAVHMCSGDNREKVAKIMSDCRDDPSCTDHDCIADRAANSYGRNGGNCASRYLCQSTHRCAYSPCDSSCAVSNC